MRRPRIAIPEIDQDVKNYTRAVMAAGMEPVVISVQSKQFAQCAQQEYLDYLEFRVEAYDGLLIPGGWDINPRRYGQENRGSRMVTDAVDELQFELLDVFVKSGKPVFGICRGHQIINVYFGGTLIQDLPTSFRHAWSKESGDRVHRCIAAEGSWLAGIYGTDFFHNSAHHQAVDRLGKGLVTDGRCAEDGTIEALHHASLPIYSVQWHPERMSLALAREDTVDGLPVFRFFCRLCGGIPDEYAALSATGLMADRMGL